MNMMPYFFKSDNIIGIYICTLKLNRNAAILSTCSIFHNILNKNKQIATSKYLLRHVCTVMQYPLRLAEIQYSGLVFQWLLNAHISDFFFRNLANLKNCARAKICQISMWKKGHHYRREVLITFQLHGYTWGFYPQAQKLEPHYKAVREKSANKVSHIP